MKLTCLVFVLFAGVLAAVPTSTAQDKRKAVPPITVRTENYPRPPYSGATYYIYDQSERTIHRIVEQPELSSGHTFSFTADSPRYRLNLVEDHRHDPEHLFHNPYGVWDCQR